MMTREEFLKAHNEQTWLVVKDPFIPSFVIRADTLIVEVHGAAGPGRTYLNFRYFKVATPNDLLKYGE